MSVIGSNALAGAAGQGGGGYVIEKSLRFNPGDNAHLDRTPSSAGNQRTFTIAFWAKLCDISSNTNYFYTAGSGSPGGLNSLEIGIDLYNRLFISEYGATLSDYFIETTSAYHRDPSAWYHFIIAVDTTQSTATDRVKFYVNGVEQDKESTSYPFTQNRDTAINGTSKQTIGSDGASDLSGYLADFFLIDGSQKDATDFGEFDDNNVWRPKEFTGTYGTNGFHLDFADGNDIGNDAAGSNNWSVNNLTATGGTVNYVDSISGSPYIPINAFSTSHISNYVNTSTWAITDTAWMGAWDSSGTSNTFTPTDGIAVSSSLIVYYGNYNNAATTTTLTITYTDSSTETDTFTSGNNNWMGSFTASNASGKTIQSINISANTYQSFGGFVIDGQILTSANPDTDILRDSPTNGDATADTGAGGEVSGNYATWNPLYGIRALLENGNLEAKSSTAGAYAVTASTLAMTSGKYYMEYTYAKNGGNFVTFGVSQTNRNGSAGNGVTDLAEDLV